MVLFFLMCREYRVLSGQQKSAGFLGYAALRPALSFGSTMRVPNGISDARSLVMRSFGSLRGNLRTIPIFLPAYTYLIPEERKRQRGDDSDRE
jgi:hypothetical protein